MPTIQFLNPIDQPIGTSRLIDEIRSGLCDPEFDMFRLAVAAVTQGTLLRLDAQIRSWRARGGSIEAVYGVDIAATTVEALLYSLVNFNAVYVSRIPGIKFHPKVYIFSGATKARVFVGSNNFTVPGTETNFEAAVRVDYTLPGESVDFGAALVGWHALLAETASDTVYSLNPHLVRALEAEGYITSEKALSAAAKGGRVLGKKGLPTALPKSSLRARPPSAMPATKMVAGAGPQAIAAAPGAPQPGPVLGANAVDTLAIQIRPHHNGEIFLSKLAVNQNPTFFGFPFTGLTVPKRPGNPTYPQRTPDPVVNIRVFGLNGAVLVDLHRYDLNTVYYSTKSEIRITCSQLVAHVPEFSILVMQPGDAGSGIDYAMEIYRPDSPDYADWLSVCNQTMPGGGSAPRKFGWL